MGADQEAIDFGPSQMYPALIQLVIHSETVTWNRFTNYLTGNSILVVAWATLFAAALKKLRATPIVLLLISIIGAAASVAFFFLGIRGRAFLARYSELARRLEGGRNLLPGQSNSPKLPMTETDLTLATLEGSRPGSYQIVTLGPILSLYFYAILYAISMIYLDYIPVQFRLLGIVAAFLISGSLIVGIVPRVRVSVANKPDRRPNRPIRIAGWIFLAIGIVILVTLLFVLPQSLACILA